MKQEKKKRQEKVLFNLSLVVDRNLWENKSFVSPNFPGVATQFHLEILAMYSECLIGMDVADSDSQPTQSLSGDR